MADLDKPAFARLAFWSANMTTIMGAGMKWPGFSYTAPEKARMAELAGAVEGAAYVRFLAINTVLFIVFAAIAVVGIFVPVMTLIYPNPADLQPLSFVLMLGTTALLTIGVGLPLSMRLAARWSATAAIEKLAAKPGDAELDAKMRWQITRMTVIMCGIFVPGTLLWIAYDIHGGPIVTALKWLAFLLMAISAAHTFMTRGQR
jgi:hypothetical protein